MTEPRHQSALDDRTPPVQRHDVRATIKVEGVEDILRLLIRIDRKLNVIHHMEEQQMAALSDIEAGVQAESDVITAVETLVTNILAQVMAAGTDAERQAIFDKVTANTGRLGALVAAGTPADPGGEVPPPVDEPPVA